MWNLGYWDTGLMRALNLTLDLEPIKLGYWDISPLKLGDWDIDPQKLGYLRYWDITYS